MDGACTGFIFAALLEFTLTNYLWRKGQKSCCIRSNNEDRESGSSNFGAMAATASAAAVGLDPNMFTHMVTVGAATGNAAADDPISGAGIRRSSRFRHFNKTTCNEEEIPLTSPAHHLLKRKPFCQFPLR